jgi:hypothetical protein
MGTPEFLTWAIEFGCPVRGFQDGSDPERTERQLRVARAVSDAEREGRVFDGVAVKGDHGFRLEEALEVYGGRAAVEAACPACPANVLATDASPNWVGCYGLVERPSRSEWFDRAVDQALSGQAGAAKWIPRTTPAWYGLWMGSPLAAERALFVARVLELMEEEERKLAKGLDELGVALLAASERGLVVHVAVYPQGSVEAGWFLLAPHCPRCKVTWLARKKQMCSACGYEGSPAPLRKRRARGRRPYFPLVRLLGEEEAREFLGRMSGE